MTGSAFLCLTAFLSAFSADALGLSVKLTRPEAVTGLLPLAKTILDGRHLPFSLMKSDLHLVLLDANAPNFPFWNVSSHENVPGSPTDSVNVIAPVVGLKDAPVAVKLLLAADTRDGMSGDIGVGDVGIEVDVDGALTAKDCWACGAGLKLALPAWLASIVQMPDPMKLTVEPDIEHTEPLEASIVKPTGLPDAPPVAVTA